MRLKILTMNDMKLDPNLFQTLIIHGEGEAIQIIVRLEGKSVPKTTKQFGMDRLIWHAK